MKLDHYDLVARLVPAFLTLVPLPVVLYIAFPDAVAVWPTWGSLLASAGIGFLMLNTTRDRGHAVQTRLINKYGELPSVTIQRFSCEWLDSYTQIRRKKRLNELLPELPLMTPELEAARPDDCAKAYRSVVEFLKSKTRDKATFNLVYQELVHYGFRRNLLGMKPQACALLLMCAFCVFVIEYQRHFPIRPADLLGVAVLALLAYCWIFVVRLRWVESTSRAYSERLFEAVEKL